MGDPTPQPAAPNVDGGLVVRASGGSGKSGIYQVLPKYQFILTGLYQAPWGINLGANFFGRQGFPQPFYVQTRATDAAGVSHRYQTQIAQADTYRYDNVYQLDLRLAKTFQIGPISATPSAELFNVANSGVVLQRGAQVGIYRASSGSFSQTSTFNDIYEVQSPRIVRLGINVAF